MKPLVPLLTALLSTSLLPAQEIGENGSVRFSLTAPEAKEVVLRAQWNPKPIPLTRGEKGDWAAVVESVPAGVWEYSFGVDGVNVMDSRNPKAKPQRQPAKSILHIPSTPPAPWDWQDVPHGTIHTHGYLSKALGQPRELVVYTPPGYEKDSATKYPLLVLQHGSGDNQRTWTEHGKAHWILDSLIAQQKAKPMIVLMIDGHPHGQLSRESPEAKRAASMDAFRRELLEDALPLVESVYRVQEGPAAHAFAGLSMGGGQSLNVGLAHTDRFAWIGAFSAATPSPEGAEKLIPDAAATNAKLRLLWIAVGKDDFLLQRNEAFIGALKQREVKHAWQVTEGDHSWPVWRRYLAEFLPLLFQVPQS